MPNIVKKIKNMHEEMMNWKHLEKEWREKPRSIVKDQTVFTDIFCLLVANDIDTVSSYFVTLAKTNDTLCVIDCR